MASVDQIAQLRLLIAEPEDAEPYTDAALSVRIDADGAVNKTAYNIWVEKAAAAAQLVDTSEGGSSRKMGDVYEQSLKMAEYFKGLVEDGTPVSGGTVIRKLRRP